MIQFETVKYGILKAKDNQRSSKDSTSSCSEEDVFLPETNSLTDGSEPSCTDRFDDAQEVLLSSSEKVLCTDLKMDTTETEELSDFNAMHRTGYGDDKVSKHNEDAANNNGSNGERGASNGAVAAAVVANNNDDVEVEKPETTAQPEGAFPPGYFSLEGLQKMQQIVSAAMANNSDNEDAQKQLAVFQSTLFTLQHQQLFQLQLIQQLQSQLSINRSDKDENEEDDDEELEDEREEGELTEEQMAEEQRKYEEEQRQLRKEEEERLKAKREALKSASEKDGLTPLNPNSTAAPSDTISAMEASFSSSFASTIITNHDQPSSMDGLNSLEMLQKRAEEVLDSASRGILSGSLTDEMSFKNDGKGRNEPFFKHRCRYCGKVFGSDSALQIHIRSHTGERPFKCNVCGSRFTTKGNLKVHFQRHTQKFPNIHMNPNPIPEHLDKFYPPLLPPLPPGQQPPLSPPLPPSANTRPQAPMSLPFPPIPGLPPGLQGLQGLGLQGFPGLPPMFRPPFDLLKHPFFGAMCDAAQQEEQHQKQQQKDQEDKRLQQQKMEQHEQQKEEEEKLRLKQQQQQHQHQMQLLQQQQSEQDVPADLSKPAINIICSPTIIKEEPKEEEEEEEDEEEEPLSLSPQPKQISPSPPAASPSPPKPSSPTVILPPSPSHALPERLEQQKVEEEMLEKHQRRSVSPTSSSPPHHRDWKDDNNKDSSSISPTKSIEDYSMKDCQPENLSSKMSSKLSPLSSVGSSFRENHHYHDNQNEMKMFPSMMPRPGSTDNSWESYIDIDRSSETSKLQQLVDNIENKITDPNECAVCHKVLSCRSALQMHYRTHTGERPFRCRICGRAFTTKGNLKTHMSVHRMKPPMRTIHQCPVCHRKYSNSLVLQQHIRVHTGQQPDLTPEQIDAAEIRDFPTLSPGSFPMGINPFAFQIPGMPGMGPESSNGDNDDFMDDDFDDGASNFDENMSNAGSISGDSNQNVSNLSRSNTEENHSRAISAMLADHNKSVENLSRAASTASHAESIEEKCSTPRMTTPPPQPSPAPSDISQGALDLTPRSEPKTSPPMMQQPPQGPPTSAPGLGAFPNFPFMPHVSTASPTMMSNALNSLAQSVAPMGPFNPMALAGIRGNTTCKICLKTFACQSALEIHYRSHTKERPFKCTICDKAFTTKNEELIHTSLHFQIYGNMKQHMMTHKLRDMPPYMMGSSGGSNSGGGGDATTPTPPQSIASSHHDTPSHSPEHHHYNHHHHHNQPQKESPQIRIKSESELSPRSSENGSCRSGNGMVALSLSQERLDRRERSLPPQFQAETNYQLMMMERQQIKNESRLKRSPSDIDQPSPKRSLVSESHASSQELPPTTTATNINTTNATSLSNIMKEAFHIMPPQHPDDQKQSSSHLERLQQFHTSSLLTQPMKMETHLKPTTSPGGTDAGGDQKHYCHLCQKNFSSTSSLQIHMRTHTGERPFVCNVCQKAFTTKGNLKVHMGIHTWSGASRRGRRMSLELPFNGSMPLMLQNPDFLQRHSDFFHPYPPTHMLSRMQQSMEQQQRGAPHSHPPPPPPILNLAHKYMNSNGLMGSHGLPQLNHTVDGRPLPYNSTPSPCSDRQTSPNSIRDEIMMESPKRNGDLSPTRTATPDLSPRLWKLHYESKAMNRANSKNDEQSKPVEELIA